MDTSYLYFEICEFNYGNNQSQLKTEKNEEKHINNFKIKIKKNNRNDKKFQ
jgi:hypothetical protein